jgi:hypothetical protein
MDAIRNLPTLADQPRKAQPKPERGTAQLAREKVKAERKATEDEAILAAKQRDGFRCRWPEAHKCRGGLEGAHVFQHRGMGGNPAGDRTTPELILPLCAWMHRRGPESIDGKQLKVEALTDQGTRGPCVFYRQAPDGSYFVVAQERVPFAYERD